MDDTERPGPRYIRLGKRRIRVPRRKGVRVGLGLFFVIGGMIPGPPGPHFIPVGLAMLSIDWPRLRRFRRKTVVKIGRRRNPKSLAPIGAMA